MYEGSAFASQVCLACKLRKRKCSKALPSCSLCSKLLLKCDYEYIPSQLRNPSPQDSSHSSQPSPTHETLPTELATTAKLLSDLSGYQSNSTLQQTTTIPTQVLAILASNGESVPALISTFFRTIDVWLPILDLDKWKRRIDVTALNHDVKLASLLLSMCLITRSPKTGSAASELYFQAKALQSALVLSGNPSIEVIQSGLLIAFYEQGHGMTEAAPITISACSRMAIKMLGKEGGLLQEDIQNTELGRVWWAIVMLDGYMNLGASPAEIALSAHLQHAGPLLIGLPGDDEVPAKPNTTRLTTSGISAATGATTRLGPFCRAAEAAHLLGRVQDLVAQSAWSHQIDVDSSTELDGSLQKLAMSLVQHSVHGWEECCAAIGLCLSALLTLHLRILELYLGIPGQETRVQAASMTLRSTTRMTIDISERLQLDLAFIDVFALPLLSFFCIYQATLLHIQFADDSFLSENWISDIEHLKVALAHFSKRWTLGNSYLTKIDNAVATKVRTGSDSR